MALSFKPNGNIDYEGVKLNGLTPFPTFNQMQTQTDLFITQADVDVDLLELQRRKWDKALKIYGLDGLMVLLARAGTSGDWSQVATLLAAYDATP